MLIAVRNRATFAARNEPPSSKHFFAANSLPYTLRQRVCGEKMFSA